MGPCVGEVVAGGRGFKCQRRLLRVCSWTVYPVRPAAVQLFFSTVLLGPAFLHFLFGAFLSESANHGLLLLLETTEVVEHISNAETSRRLWKCWQDGNTGCHHIALSENGIVVLYCNLLTAPCDDRRLFRVTFQAIHTASERFICFR